MNDTESAAAREVADLEIIQAIDAVDIETAAASPRSPQRRIAAHVKTCRAAPWREMTSAEPLIPDGISWQTEKVMIEASFLEAVTEQDVAAMAASGLPPEVALRRHLDSEWESAHKRAHANAVRDMNEQAVRRKAENRARIAAERAANVQPPKAKRFVSLQEAAEYLSVSPRTVRRLIADGVIVGYRLGPRLLRVDLNEIEARMRRIPTAEWDGA